MSALKLLLYIFLININYLSAGEIKFRSDYTLFSQVNAWFKLHRVPTDWQTARLQCYYEGAILASPFDHDTLWILKNIMSQAKLDTIFTGIHATHNGVVYTSVEGVPLEQMPIQWENGEPNNEKGKECMALSNGGLGKKTCEDYAPYICYKKLNASDEMNECGTIDNDYKLDARTGHCYKFHEDKTTWPRAYSICQAEGGYLTIINSETEANLLKEIFTKRGIKNDSEIFIGFRNWGPSDYHWTIHGEEIKHSGYAVWDTQEPNNIIDKHGTPQLCGSIRTIAKLNDYWCNYTGPFICEKTKDSLLNLQPGYYKFASCHSDGKRKCL